MNSATETAIKVRTGRLSAAAVTNRALATARASHEDLNAFTLIDGEGAMSRAEGIDALIGQGKDPGPLSGVPIALKDLIDQAGLPNRKGSSFPASPSATSAAVVRRLGAAGAVIIGRTGLHEFAFGFTSENPWFGPVRNPWDLATSPGGSSGGSAVAVAAGIVPIGIGTDTGGSVRVPAALCGIYGLKVTHGRVPLSGVFPLVASLDTVGPMARTVDDLTAAYLVMAGDDPTDPWSQPQTVEAPTADGRTFRVGFVHQWCDRPMTTEVADGMNTFRDLCRAASIETVDVDEATLSPIRELSGAIGPEIIEVHGERLSRHPDRYSQDIAARIEQARNGTAADLTAALRWAAAARATIARLTSEGIDALISPTVGAMRKTIGDETISVNGAAVFHRDVLSPFTSPINRIGVPAIAAPVTGTGSPAVSIQLVGAMWSEANLLALAHTLEAASILKVSEPPIFFEESP